MKAYLTVDDIATERTAILTDYLTDRQIKALMFVWGQRADAFADNCVYAIKKGMVLGNHSYSHPAFTSLTMEKAREEILKNDRLIESFYKKAGIKRPFKAFRFPYGDCGSALEDSLDDFLKNQGFTPLKDSAMALKKRHSVLWDFDFREYKVRPVSGISFSEIYKKAENFLTEWKADKEKFRDFIPVILIHDHTETEDMEKNYFEKLINLFLDNGVEFIPPCGLSSCPSASE
ncbi:polysaccharide deacetylase family protein [Treponema sp.]|uniref:polysaccharide deacetylase family protein n=1 Tax=Treponema sp. TaxID=166 RepID=UPI0025D83726|nr:polysaccharide deacetylase family protein [Treponema sp.]MCR5217710.1 polysaccharide deacetylase family protein [Treponema sp.]